MTIVRGGDEAMCGEVEKEKTVALIETTGSSWYAQLTFKLLSQIRGLM